MRLPIVLAFLLLLLGLSSITSLGQVKRVQGFENKLPSVSQPAGCSLVLSYLHDAFEKATSKSTVTVIIKLRNTKNMGLAKSRSNNLKSYIRFLGLKNFEVVM